MVQIKLFDLRGIVNLVAVALVGERKKLEQENGTYNTRMGCVSEVGTIRRQHGEQGGASPS